MTRNAVYAEALGPSDARPMVFLPPNSMDGRAWIYQMNRFATRYRTITVDLPGCTRGPMWEGDVPPGAVAAACWDAVEQVSPGSDPAVLVGCSIGSRIAQAMYHLRPASTAALVLTGTGFTHTRNFAPMIAAYESRGLQQRRLHVLEGFSERFRESSTARWFQSTQSDGSSHTNVDVILRSMRAAAVSTWEPQPIDVPVLILTGDQDIMHQAAFELQRRLVGSTLEVLQGAGHVAQVEAPQEFDEAMDAFLSDAGLHP